MECCIKLLNNYLCHIDNATLVVTISDELAERIGETGECSLSLNQHPDFGWLPSGTVSLEALEIVRC